MELSNFQFKQDKICCIADIHIGVHQNSQMWLDICDSWTDWLVLELNKNNIKDIVICGDLFHYRDEIAVNTIHHVSNFLFKLKDFNIISALFSTLEVVVISSHQTDCFLFI